MIENIKKELYSKKIVIIIVLTIFLIGLLFGSIYITVVDKASKKEIATSVTNYINSYNNIKFSTRLNIFKQTLGKNSFFFISMWALGLSIIGIPLILIMIFFKSFTIGFSIGSIFGTYKFKGILYLLIYLIEGPLITSILSIILGIYSINVSIKLVYNVFLKKNLNFQTFMGKYLFMIMITFLILVFLSLFDSFISPILYKLIKNML
ncbi:MAG: stage II sporulation protein M [Bacilli bacterium]|nr:stage II sporulation protein M [Bacilli bacterium]